LFFLISFLRVTVFCSCSYVFLFFVVS
jgi:hypothetical protein